MTIIGGIEVPKTGVKILHDPEKLINLLHDLPDSAIIFDMLEIFKTSEKTGKMIYRHPNKETYMILLYKYPKWMEPEEVTNPSEIVLFLSSSLSELIKFFYFWFNKEEDANRKTIIYEISNLLYEHQRLEKEEKIQPHY